MVAWWKGLDNDKRLLVASAGAAWLAQLLYLVSPIDLIPDFIPLLGQLDDLAALTSTVLFTVFVVRRVRGDRGFSGLVPEALRPRSVAPPSDVPEPERDPHEADLAGHGDDMGIEGYRPLSLDELKAL